MVWNIFYKIVLRIINQAQKYQIRKVKEKYLHVHKSVSMGNNTNLIGPVENIRIGQGTYLNEAFIAAGRKSKITIGENCAIGYNVRIRSFTHGLNKVYNDDISEHEIIEKDILIGNKCWIGDNVFIKEGITLGDNVIVGANSVVTKSFGSNVIIAGCPAKIIKQRT